MPLWKEWCAIIPAEPSKRFNSLFLRYTEHYLLRRSFRSLSVRGHVEPQVAAAGEYPVLYVMNHSSWWDGLLLYYVAQRQSKRWHYAMMDEAQLRRYRFFRKLGAFSIDKSSARAGLESLHYTAGLLEQNGRVWMFPQGGIYHLEHRPLAFQSGIGVVLERCPRAIAVPVSAYYSISPHQQPDITLWFGEPIAEAWDTMPRKTVAALLCGRLEAQLDEHRGMAVAANGERLPGFEHLYAPGRSTSERFDVFKRKVSLWKSYFGQ